MASRRPSGLCGAVPRREFLRSSGLVGGGLVLWAAAACAPTVPPSAPAPTSAAAPTVAPAAAAAPLAPLNAGQVRPSAATPPPARDIPKDVDAWLRVGQDGKITLATGKVEYGQGIQTGFAQLAADELDVPFDSVQVVMGNTDAVPWDVGTYGSQSTRKTGPLVRQVSAEMRQWLLDLGSAKLGVPADGLATQNGTVYVVGQPDQFVTYADLAAGQSSGRQMTGQAPLKSPDQFQVIGQEIARVDIPTKVNGVVKYGYDTTVPGMLHGKVVRPPSVGATLTSIDFSQAQAMPGVVGVFHDGDFAGLAAQRLDQANAALATVNAQWQELDSPVTSDTIFDDLKSTPDQGKTTPTGDPDAGMSSIVRPLSVTVRAPFVAHAQIEPESALAQAQGDSLDVWTSTQSPFGMQDRLAQELSWDRDKILVHAQMSGGAFGRKNLNDVGIEAAKLAVGIGQPVRVNWTREEEFLFDQFRPAMLIELQTGLDANNEVSGWGFDLYSAAYYAPLGPKPMFASADAGINAPDIYGLPNARTTFYQSKTPFPVMNWRANGSPVNALARETAMDELAEMAGQDPVSFREKLLADNPRMVAVMQAAVDKAGWTPTAGRSGQGIGLALEFADGTYVAEVAQVSVDPSSGTVRVQHVDVAVDCGLIVNPLAARQQIIGSVVSQGVSSTLKEQILFASGKVQNNSFAAYNPLTILEAPTVDVVFVEDKTQPMQGLGEPAVGPVSAAVSNAIYDAVGVRLRDLPFNPARVKAALQTMA